jgi:hypothetical protein
LNVLPSRIGDRDAATIMRVLRVVERHIPESNILSIEFRDDCKYPEFIPKDKEGGACIVFPTDLNKWWYSGSVTHAVLIKTICNGMKVKQVSRETLIAFTILHEIHHMLLLHDREDLWIGVQYDLGRLAAERCALAQRNYHPESAYWNEEIYRQIPIEYEADMWAMYMMREHASELCERADTRVALSSNRYASDEELAEMDARALEASTRLYKRQCERERRRANPPNVMPWILIGALIISFILGALVF